MVYNRERGKASDMGVPFFVFLYIKRLYNTILHSQGYGRHTEVEGNFIPYTLDSINKCLRLLVIKI